MTEHTTTTSVHPVETRGAKLTAGPAVMGQIVAYYHAPTVQTGGAEESPAVVLAVRDTGALRLCVFGAGVPELVEGVLQGDGVGQWQPIGTASPSKKKAES